MACLKLMTVSWLGVNVEPHSQDVHTDVTNQDRSAQRG